MQRHGTLIEAIYRVYKESGFSMAGSVAFSLVLSLFPFCIFLGALAGVFGGRELAQEAVTDLFKILPEQVAQALAPEIGRVMGDSRIDLATAGGALALFFATSAVETLRTALNEAYRVSDTRPYLLSLLISMLLVIGAAVTTLVLTWGLVVGPALAARFEPYWFRLDSPLWQLVLGATRTSPLTRYLAAAVVLAALLFALHLWLPAGKRSFKDVWPGVALTVVLWLTTVALYSTYLSFSDYSRFYAGLSHVMVALIFFQYTAIIIILGAELNRGIMEINKARAVPAG